LTLYAVFVILYNVEKTCNKCNVSKLLTEFRKGRKSCKDCAKIYCKQWRETNEEHHREYIAKYKNENKELINSRAKIYYEENKEECIRRSDEWKKNNASYVREYSTKYFREKRETDFTYVLKNNISRNISISLRKNNRSKQGKSTFAYLPYTIEELKTHIESQFEPWMIWGNRGKYNKKTWDDNDPSTWKWQLDHIIPHSTFYYTSMEDDEFKKCWALENLRPYSAKQNILDGASRIRHKII